MYRIGTSGYNYDEWKGSFYPEKMPSAKMLPYYAERFSTVEINYTFYRMPSEKTIEGWVESTPDDFLFTLKASRRITHHAKLSDCEELTDLLFERARGLGEKLGIVLFQLPPYFKKDVDILAGFLDLVPPDIRAAFEFRSKSWLSDDVYELLRERGAALCVKDDEKFSTPVEITAGHAYFRLRDEGYTAEGIAEWAGTIRNGTRGIDDVFIYFKHEDKGVGPEFARMMTAALETA